MKFNPGESEYLKISGFQAHPEYFGKEKLNKNCQKMIA